MAHISDANVSTTTSTTPGTLASITPRRPPIISPMSIAYGAGWVTRPVSPGSGGVGRSGRLGIGGQVRTLGRHAAHGAAAGFELLGERDRVLERRSAGIIVEVDVDVARVVREHLADRLGPPLQLVVAVERPTLRLVPTLVKPQVTPVGRSPQWRDRALAVGPAQRGVVLLQALPYVVRPPGLVARFDGQPQL